MRNLPVIRQIWEESDGKFFGLNRPMGRVTVEPAWALRMTGQVYGAGSKGPYRWFYREDQSQTEIEVPNIKSISIDRSIDKDAADCTIVMYNQYHAPAAEVNPEAPLGNPGYFSYNYGNSKEAPLFGQAPNEWSNTLIPNALIRTYQGLGGWEMVGSNFQAKSIEDAVSDGNIDMTGTWLIDKVTLGTDGLITLKCRDMAKLLIDQSVFVPLVPDRYYPLKYARYVYDQVPGEPEDKEPGEAGSLRHFASSTRRWGSATVHGTTDTNVWDGKEDTWSISSGSSHWNNQWAKDWWEGTFGSDTGVAINSIYVSAKGGAETGMPYVDGGYPIWISIMEDGHWQKGKAINPATANVIPWDDHDGDGKSDTLVSSMGASNVPALHTDINYVLFGSVQNGSNGGEWFQLDRIYHAQRIRITLAPVWKTNWGPNYYRSGLRSVKARLTNVNPTGSLGGNAPVRSNSTVTRGDAIAIIHDFAGSPTGSPSSGFTDVTASRHIPAVNWAKANGITTGVTATTFAPNRPVTRAEFVTLLWRAADSPGGSPPHPFMDVQQSWQAAPVNWAYYKNVTTGTSSRTFEPDALVTGTQVSLFMSRYGDAIDTIPSFWNIVDTDYPGETIKTETVRRDGNLKDWVDPVKDLLLWSGFLFYETSPGAPKVHGILEFSGTWPEEDIGEEVFDKKTIIDAINTIKEVLGHVFFIDERGGVRFHSPNWWASGNMTESGARTSYVPELLDTKSITDYSSVYSDDLVRSEIILGNVPLDEEAYAEGGSNVHIDPNALSSVDLLRGMTKPAIWVNEVFTDKREQKLMATLIGLHLLFQSKTGQVTAPANPEIQLDDQVRITERISAESYIHYVRGIRTTMDLDSGEYLMTLTTNWLGEEDEWAFNRNDLLALFDQIDSGSTQGSSSTGSSIRNKSSYQKGRGQSTPSSGQIPGTDPGTDRAGP